LLQRGAGGAGERGGGCGRLFGREGTREEEEEEEEHAESGAHSRSGF